jgi:hypothetical protein
MSMPLPEFTRKLIEGKLSQYCKKRFPQDTSHNLRLVYKIEGNNATLILSRPYFRNPAKWAERAVAQMRFDNDLKKWQLYFMDRNNQWRPYPFFPPVPILMIF